MDSQFLQSFIIIGIALVIVWLSFFLRTTITNKTFSLRMNNPTIVKIFDFSTAGLAVVLAILMSTSLRFSIYTDVLAIICIIMAIITLVLILKHKINSSLYIVIWIVSIIGLMKYFLGKFLLGDYNILHLFVNYGY